MKMRLSKKIARLKLTAIVILVSVLFAACSNAVGKGEGGQSEDVIRVVTTIAQIAEPISVIGGERVQVTSLMGPGVDPHLYNASQGDIRKLRERGRHFLQRAYLEANMTEVFEQIGKTRPVLAVAEAIPSERLLTDEDRGRRSPCLVRYRSVAAGVGGSSGGA